MLRAAVLALAILLVPAGAAARGSDPGTNACDSKSDVLDHEARASRQVMFADLPADLSQRLTVNLKHFEAVDLTGADLMIVRQLGAGSSRIDAYRAGCRVRSLTIDNLYLNELLRVRLEEGN